MKKSVLFFATLILLTTAACDKCDKPDICEGITCLNGGTCVNGNCDCPEGFGGSDCGEEIKPLSITVKKVTVKNFPPTDPNGGGWDADTGPDIYVKIERKNDDGTYTSAYNTEQSKKDNADYKKQYSFSDNSTSLKPDFSYRILLYDSDINNPDQEMDKKSFSAYKVGDKFPNPIVVSAPKGTTFELTVEYKW